MKHFTGLGKRGIITISLLLIALCGLAALPLNSQARPDGVSVVINNNTSRGMRNVFFAPVGTDDWGENQLTRVVMTGQNATVSIADCPGSSVKLIAEDTDGCFMTTVVSCGGEAEWTLTNNTVRDCGN